ncbi:prevent-host-death family protein [Rudaeicoccus suwonensis]|uniref:Antitoxin n=2 Tax=Rudaeicoccus suwonensis TaxID=657409 RepID=A0A561E834_9MICO|nr:prevent-host-death family protein [Rudaeicoccus suwonensis]
MCMSEFTSQVSVADLRTTLSDTINRAAYGHERVGITRRGKVTAVLVSVEDAIRLEQLEDEADLAAYRAAKAADDGTRISLDDLLADTDS